MTLAALQAQAEQAGAAVGRCGVLVSGLQERKSAQGTRFFRMNISDPTGQVAGMALFPEDFDATRRVLEASPMVILALEARFNGGQFDPVARSASPMDMQACAQAWICASSSTAKTAAELVASLLDRISRETAKVPPGKVTLCVSLDDPGEIDIPVGEFPITPAGEKRTPLAARASWPSKSYDAAARRSDRFQQMCNPQLWPAVRSGRPQVAAQQAAQTFSHPRSTRRG